MKLWTLLKLTFDTKIKTSIYCYLRWGCKGTGLQTLTPGRSTTLSAWVVAWCRALVACWRDGAGAVRPVLMGLCCARDRCWRGSSSSPEMEGEAERSSEVKNITHFLKWDSITERLGFKRPGVVPWIFLLFTEWTWRFGALLNHHKNMGPYFLLPKALSWVCGSLSWYICRCR